MSSLKERIFQSAGFRKFPMLDILASFIVAFVSVVLQPIYSDMTWGLVTVIALLGFIWFLGALVDYGGGRRRMAKSREEAVKNVVYGARMIIVSIIASILILLLLQLYAML